MAAPDGTDVQDRPDTARTRGTWTRCSPKTAELVRRVLDELAPDAQIETVSVESIEDAERLGFRGEAAVRTASSRHG